MAFLIIILFPVGLIVWLKMMARPSKHQADGVEVMASNAPYRAWAIAVRGAGLLLGAIAAFMYWWNATTAPGARFWDALWVIPVVWGGAVALSVVLGHVIARRRAEDDLPVATGTLNFRRETMFIFVGVLTLLVLFAVADVVTKSADGGSTYVAFCQQFHDGVFDGRFQRQGVFPGREFARQALASLGAVVVAIGVMSLLPLLDMSRAGLIPALRQETMGGVLAAITFALGVSVALHAAWAQGVGAQMHAKRAGGHSHGGEFLERCPMTAAQGAAAFFFWAAGAIGLVLMVRSAALLLHPGPAPAENGATRGTD